MVDDYVEQLGQSLAFEDYIPLKWESAPAGIEYIQTAHLNEVNEEILQFLVVMDRYNRDNADEDIDAHHDSEFYKVDQKLNIVLDLLMQLLHFQQPSIQSYPVQLTCRHVTWQAEQNIPEINSHIFIDLFLQRNFPRPVRFYGKVDQIDREGSGPVKVMLSLIDLSETVCDLLAKLIFRQHRRRVALAKRKASSE